MAAAATSWAAAVVGRTVVEVPTAWDPVPMRSMAAGMSIVVRTRIGTAITSTHIGTAITRAIPHTVALAGGGLQTGDACGCAATGIRPMDIGTATIARTIATAIMVGPTDAVRPTDTVRPMDTDAGNV